MQFLETKDKMFLIAFCLLTKECDLLITMTKNYTQLSLVQRYQIEALVTVGMKQKMSALTMGVDFMIDKTTRGLYAS